VISQEQIAAWNCGTSSTQIVPSHSASADAKAQVAAAASHQGHKREIGKNQISSVFTCKVTFSNIQFKSDYNEFASFFHSHRLIIVHLCFAALFKFVLKLKD
jgi:hypothetical protein